MRSTFRIDGDLLDELREQAHREKVSLTLLLNRVLRLGMEAERDRARRSSRHRERTYAMGEPRTDLRKALAPAAALEDDEIVNPRTDGGKLSGAEGVARPLPGRRRGC